MFRFVVVLAVCALAAPVHADTSLDEGFAAWKKLRDPEVISIRFDDGYRFLNAHPDWPEIKLIRMRTEAAAMLERPDAATMQRFCRELAPISGRGMIACAVAKAGDAKQQEEWVRQAWIQGDFNEDEEKRVFKSYESLLGKREHDRRMERLLYERKKEAAKRLLKMVPLAKRSLYEVRLAFITKDKLAPRMLAHLTHAERGNDGVIYERLRWRSAHGEDDLSELMLTASTDLYFPDLWWPMRAEAVREALARHDTKRALKLLAQAGDVTGENLADALWLKGWIKLRKNKDSANAYKDFFSLYTKVSTPVSKARAAYWAGRAAENNGNHAIAVDWMQKAATHPTVFYGQLAQMWLKQKTTLTLPPSPKPSEEIIKKFNNREMVRMVRALHIAGNAEARDQFLASLARQDLPAEEYELVARLAYDVAGVNAAVEVAKLALRDGIVLIGAGWPVISTPPELKLEPALTLAITRQESEFDPRARSNANARGLMQLLPGTAQHVAKKLGMPYEDKMLENPMANLTLGSSYLGSLIAGFDGNYILGIASYNAGPANVRKWIASMGSPPNQLEARIDWIESIPFAETRNYVMRALENLNVYRALLNAKAPLAIEQDILR